MGCTTSTVVESAQMGVFQDESGVITPEVRFKERSHSFHSMDDRTNPYTAAHASAPINFTHKHWVKQLESVTRWQFGKLYKISLMVSIEVPIYKYFSGPPPPHLQPR